MSRPVHPSEIATGILACAIDPDAETEAHLETFDGCACANTRILARAYLDLLASINEVKEHP